MLHNLYISSFKNLCFSFETELCTFYGAMQRSTASVQRDKIIYSTYSLQWQIIKKVTVGRIEAENI